MTYNPATPAGQVRLLISDTNSDDPVFSDGEITSFLSMEASDVRMAAAAALDVIASDEALTSKVVTNNGISTNGAAVAAALSARAKSLREQSLATDGGGDAVFEFVALNDPTLNDTSLQPPWWFLP